MKKFILSTFTILVLLTTVSFAGTWKQDAMGFWYDNGDGTYPKAQVQVIDGVIYGFNESGYMYANCEFTIGGVNYVAAASGVATTKSTSATPQVGDTKIVNGHTWQYQSGPSGAYWVDLDSEDDENVANENNTYAIIAQQEKERLESLKQQNAGSTKDTWHGKPITSLTQEEHDEMMYEMGLYQNMSDYAAEYITGEKLDWN